MLEFIAAIKWPITVIFLAIVTLAVAKRSPNGRRAAGQWLNRRNLRVSIAGQELDISVAETEGSMSLAAGNDSALAAIVAVPDPECDEGDHPADSEAVEAARRTAVEALSQNAVRLGWQWARRGESAPPELAVSWTNDGHPTLTMRDGTLADPDGFMLAERWRSTAAVGESFAQRFLRRVDEHNQEVLDQQAAMRIAVTNRLRRTSQRRDEPPDA